MILENLFHKESENGKGISCIRRKEKGNDIEAGQILEDLRGNVGLTGLEDLRIINRYDAQGLSDAEFDSAVKQVFLKQTLTMFIMI